MDLRPRLIHGRRYDPLHAAFAAGGRRRDGAIIRICAAKRSGHVSLLSFLGHGERRCANIGLMSSPWRVRRSIPKFCLLVNYSPFLHGFAARFARDRAPRGCPVWLERRTHLTPFKRTTAPEPGRAAPASERSGALSPSARRRTARWDRARARLAARWWVAPAR